MKVSYSQLTDLTGMGFRTLKKRLSGLNPEKQGKSLVFNSDEALPLIYGNGKTESEVLDLTRERARLAKEQADRYQLQNEESRGQLIPAEAVKKTWCDIIAAARAKLLSMPAKLAPALVALEDPKAIKQILTDGVREALTELSQGK